MSPVEGSGICRRGEHDAQQIHPAQLQGAQREQHLVQRLRLVGPHHQRTRAEASGHLHRVPFPGDRREEPAGALKQNQIGFGAERLELQEERVEVHRLRLHARRERGRQRGSEADQGGARRRLPGSPARTAPSSPSLLPQVAAHLHRLDREHPQASLLERTRQRLVSPRSCPPRTPCR